MATLQRLVEEHPDSAWVDRGRLRLGQESVRAGNQAAALELFASVALMFWYILRLLSRR